jgi:hypothetical protein
MRRSDRAPEGISQHAGAVRRIQRRGHHRTKERQLLVACRGGVEPVRSGAPRLVAAPARCSSSRQRRPVLRLRAGRPSQCECDQEGGRKSMHRRLLQAKGAGLRGYERILK